jgi:transcriptional regulator with PAS, ATPase and Fis domain
MESEAVRLLQRYNWPGNVRELQNIIERASVLETEPGVLRAALIEPWLKNKPMASVDALAGKPLADIEKQVILSTLASVQRTSHQDRRCAGHWCANAWDQA